MATRVASSRQLSTFLFSLKVAPFSPAFYSTSYVGESPVLVRDFIHAALYHPEHGYFSQRSDAVGVLDRSIKFNQLAGRKAYVKHLNAIYKQSDISWFTPVELFKPWYAHGIAEAIMRTANLSVPLKIYEIGGGSGTCAKGVMDYIKLNAPTRVYDNMSYVSVEISSSLAKKQLETVGQVNSHAARFKVECRDAADPNGWAGVEQEPCWVIMLEVLDNLPHDLIYSENQVSSWMEVWVEKKHDKLELSELYKPIQDPLIASSMEILDFAKGGSTGGNRAGLVAKNIWAKIFPRPRRCWLPTGCLKLLQVLHGALPKMSLIASDFSHLPDVRIPGERAPLVASKKDGKSCDHDNYLDAKGDADIFFPTNFWLLEHIDHYCSGWLKPHKDNSSKKAKKRLESQLSDVSSESIVVIAAVLLGKTANFLYSFVLTLLHTVGLSQTRHVIAAPLYDVVGSGLAGLIVLCDQLNPNQVCSDHKPGSDCVVCLNAMGDGDPLRMLACGHVFHKDCLDGWLHRLNFNCPLCRLPLVSEERVAITQRRVSEDLVGWFRFH